MIFFALIAVVCTVAGCTPLPQGEPPLFTDEAACMAFAQMASGEGATYVCTEELGL